MAFRVAPQVPDDEKKKILARAKRVSIKRGQHLSEGIMNHVRSPRSSQRLVLVAKLATMAMQLVWNLGKTDETMVCPDGRLTAAHFGSLDGILTRRKERRTIRKVNWGKLDVMGRELD